MSNTALNAQFWSRVAKLGITKPAQLLLMPPVQYLDYRTPDQRLTDGLKGKRLYIKLKVMSSPDVNTRSKPKRVSLRFTDGRNVAEATIFGAIHNWKSLSRGEYVYIASGVETGGWNGAFKLKNPQRVGRHQQGRIIPVYRGKEKVITPETLAEKMAVALRELTGETVAYIEEAFSLPGDEIIRRARLPFQSLGDFLRALHAPDSPEAVEHATTAVRRLGALQAILSATSEPRVPSEASAINWSLDELKAAVRNLGFKLTNDQRRGIWDILQSLRSTKPMERILTGDVGTGKTLTYGLPAYLAYKAGYNVVVAAPNTLLAGQIADELKKTLGADVELMVGGYKENKPLDRHAIIVGTSAIEHWQKRIGGQHRIDLLIVDEQQKFGLAQKEALIQPHTNLLEATATPIPRTAGLMRFGQREVTVLRACPVVKKLHSKLVGRDAREEVFSHLESLVEAGHQVALLYPQREENRSAYQLFLHANALSEEEITGLFRSCRLGNDWTPINSPAEGWNGYQLSLTPAGLERLKDALGERELKGKARLRHGGQVSRDNRISNVHQALEKMERRYPGRVVLIHGGLSTDEKTEAIRKVKAGEVDYIITTSVIEIGLTMPSLKGLCVLEAERYGANVLHQIRGRLARNGGEGFFYMMTSRPLAQMPEDSIERLRIVENSTDGFLIAERDMFHRGFGDLARDAIQQSGNLESLFPSVKITPIDVEELMRATSDQPSVEPTPA